MTDPRSYELAELFLADERLTDDARKRHTDRLAQEIQNAIEGYIEHDDDLKQARDAARGTAGGD